MAIEVEVVPCIFCKHKTYHDCLNCKKFNYINYEYGGEKTKKAFQCRVCGRTAIAYDREEAKEIHDTNCDHEFELSLKC